jgi:hypothetical protein
MPDSAVRPLFILSLPRSGSTLLLRMLVTSPCIHANDEGWILLPLLYALKPGGVRAAYGEQTCAIAFAQKTEGLGYRSVAFQHAAGAYFEHLHGSSDSGAVAYMVDKTPRYAARAVELHELFPTARFLVLLRHPLAVAASSCRTFRDGRFQPPDFAVDLADGIMGIDGLLGLDSARVHVVRFEDLVEEPEHVLGAVWSFLDIPTPPWREFPSVSLQGALGDETGVLQYKAVASRRAGEWADFYANALRLRWAVRYMRWLGGAAPRVAGHYGPGLPPGAPTALGSGIARDAFWLGLAALRTAVKRRILRQEPWRLRDRESR